MENVPPPHVMEIIQRLNDLLMWNREGVSRAFDYEVSVSNALADADGPKYLALRVREDQTLCLTPLGILASTVNSAEWQLVAEFDVMPNLITKFVLRRRGQ